MIKWIKFKILYYLKLKRLEEIGLSKFDVEEYLEVNGINKEDFVFGKKIEFIKKVSPNESRKI